MSDPEKISIIIPAFNSPNTLRRTLETARDLRDANMEIMVVDDASTEDIASLLDVMGLKHSRLTENSGPATARTEGARLADGEILLFTDSDVWLPESLLERLRKAFAEQGADCIQGIFSKECPYDNFFSQYKNLYNRYALNQLPGWINTTFTSLTGIRKSFFFECGGFDLNIRTPSVEDRTLGENIIRHGGRIYLDKGLEVIHNRYFSARAFYRNQFHRSADLIKLMLRQKDTGYHKKGTPFGTHSRRALMRVPIAFGTLAALGLSALSLWLFPLFVLGMGMYAKLIAPWLSHLKEEKGWRFTLCGLFVDFSDALASGCGVMKGFIEYKFMGKRY